MFTKIVKLVLKITGQMLSTSMLHFSYFVGLEKMCIYVAEMFGIVFLVKKQAFPMR